jgi:WD40 repeat protein
MNERELRERLDAAAPPDAAAAEERAWRVVQSAFEQREPMPRRRPRRRRVALALAAGLAGLAVAVPVTGADEWLRDLVEPGREDARPFLSSLPGGGRLLVDSSGGPWVVRAGGSKRLLGAYDAASWSPQGLFVVATRDRQLVALEPTGQVRWSLTGSTAVSGARWAPSGFRIAYISGPPAAAKVKGASAGASLRVIAGDGTGDRRLVRDVAAVPPDWRPGVEHVLAYADRHGRVRAMEADTGRLLWSTRAREQPHQLLWSHDGERLLAVADGSITVLDARGRVVRAIAAPAGTAAGAVAFRGDGRQFAVVRRHWNSGQSEAVVLEAERGSGGGRRIFAGAGEFTDLAWSPDGRWLLIGWPSADQWLFVRSSQARKVIAVSDVARQFSPGASGRPAFPAVVGWCCGE